MYRHVMAKALSDLFEKDYMQITRRIFESEPEPPSPVYTNKVPKHVSAPRSRMSKVKNKNQKSAKGKRPAPMARRDGGMEDRYAMMVNKVQMLTNKVKLMEEQLKGMRDEDDEPMQEAENVRPMTVEEKKALSIEINELTGENLRQILNIIEASRPLHREGQEIEIDLDTLPNETLRKLQDFVKQCGMSESLITHKGHGGFGNDPSKLIDSTDPFDAFNSDSGRDDEVA